MRAYLLLLAPALAAQTIVVSPAGPLKTLVEARDTARAQRRAGIAGTLTIRISDGVYYLSDTLVLTPEDSNATWEAAPGARLPGSVDAIRSIGKALVGVSCTNG